MQALKVVEPLLRYLPNVTAIAASKALLTLVLLLNIRAFPLVWHVRVFRPLIYLYAERFLVALRTIFKTRKQKKLAVDRWLERRTPVGVNPVEWVGKFNSWASIDESDYNLHLSNSSYPKVLDGARFKGAIELFPQFFRAGGTMALAGTHFHFLKEIPILAKYEVRVSLGAWDEKWMYIVCRFVTKPRKTSQKAKRPIANGNGKANGSESLLHAPVIDTTSGSSSATPLPSSSPSTTDPEDTIKTLTRRLVHEEPDGAVLHTVTVSQMCCKIGRITVPPAIVFAANGLSLPSPGQPYSHSNPPPHWAKVQAMVDSGVKELGKFYRGGWKEIPAEERWWDSALGGVVEDTRKERLEVLGMLRRAMDGAKDMQ
ncbi:hypothetical protein PQX77_022355 [Marasmius sp. AFHP31]|nr:hypothetical protein PQX77_022355 [Marasmius sp. AFHP31]